MRVFPAEELGVVTEVLLTESSDDCLPALYPFQLGLSPPPSPHNQLPDGVYLFCAAEDTDKLDADDKAGQPNSRTCVDSPGVIDAESGEQIAGYSGLVFDWDSAVYDWKSGDCASASTGLTSGANGVSETEVLAYVAHESRVADPLVRPLMQLYGLTDDALETFSPLQLKSLCSATPAHLQQLKAYRRTVLNRKYARKSRNKKCDRTESLEQELRKSLLELDQLKLVCQQKDNVIKDLRKALEDSPVNVYLCITGLN